MGPLGGVEWPVSLQYGTSSCLSQSLGRGGLGQPRPEAPSRTGRETTLCWCGRDCLSRITTSQHLERLRSPLRGHRTPAGVSGFQGARPDSSASQACSHPARDSRPGGRRARLAEPLLSGRDAPQSPRAEAWAQSPHLPGERLDSGSGSEWPHLICLTLEMSLLFFGQQVFHPIKSGKWVKILNVSPTSSRAMQTKQNQTQSSSTILQKEQSCFWWDSKEVKTGFD